MFMRLCFLRNKMYRRQLVNVLKDVVQRFSTSNSEHVVEKLNNRSLVRITGNDASNLLQGLITNDMQHLNHGAGSMFAMFLNNKGRVLYDSIIYRLPSSNSYIIEADKSVVNPLIKHLSMYRLRRDVDIVNVDDRYHIWVVFNPNLISENPKDEKTKEMLDEQLGVCSSSSGSDKVLVKTVGSENILTYSDPRLFLLGKRIISPIHSDSKVIELYGVESKPKYKWFRYRLGVGEGIEDLPPGSCFPLEANCDYLHGVSFHKGCYIGQELTARVHHTGVTRKRLMPLFFENNVEDIPSRDESIKIGDVNVGKLRGVENNMGLGLLRIAQVSDTKPLIVSKMSVYTKRPIWWPQEAPKEKLSVGKL